MTIRESLESVLYQALKAAVEAGELPLNEIPQPSLERPREEGPWRLGVYNCHAIGEGCPYESSGYRSSNC